MEIAQRLAHDKPPLGDAHDETDGETDVFEMRRTGLPNFEANPCVCWFHSLMIQ